MSIVSRLASSNKRRDEQPNIELAEDIAACNDHKAIKELVELLSSKNKDIRYDSIKVLYETGERKPGLIAAYSGAFADLLKGKDNRMVWGAMTALDAIATAEPGMIYSLLAGIVAAADTGSVITRDHAVNILVKLGSNKKYGGDCIPLLKEQLLKSPPMQVPSYAEKTLELVSTNNKETFAGIFRERMKDLEKDSQRKRLEKVLKKLEKI